MLNKKASIIILLALIPVALVLAPAISSLVTTSNTLTNTGSIVAAPSGGAQALHASGNKLVTPSGATVVLRGVDYSYFTDGPYGSWMLPNGQIEWNTWDTTAIGNNLDALKTWGCNSIRVLATVQWWKQNTNNFQSNIQYFLTQAQSRGIYVDFTFWRTNGTNTEPNGFLPWNDPGNGYISNTQDFVNLWSSVASTLKGYPNVMFELWNEPNGNSAAESSWFSVTQQCINAIRATGASNVILIQWNYNVGLDYKNYQGGSIWSLNWVTQFPLTDSANNLAYSTHMYRNVFYNFPTSDGKAVTQSDMTWALTQVGVIGFNKPLIIGEIGCDLWASNMNNEYTWYTSTLSILNQNGISYWGWAWAPWRTGTEWGLVDGTANYNANQAGQIFKQAVNS